MYSCSMLGYNSWESWRSQLIPHHVNKVTWYSSFRELMCCKISGMKHTNLQNDSYLVSVLTIAVYIPILPYTLGKQHPNLCINLPTRHLCDTTECVKGWCQMSHCILLLGKQTFHQGIFIMSGVWIYSLSYLY